MVEDGFPHNVALWLGLAFTSPYRYSRPLRSVAFRCHKRHLIDECGRIALSNRPLALDHSQRRPC